jgi:hypothetical protein
MNCMSAYGLARGMRVVQLTGFVKAAVPALYITSLPRNAIGFSFEGGVFGVLCGALLFAASMLIAFVLSGALGLLAFPFSMWLIGGSSVLMIYNSTASSLAFVKPLCAGCRLRPIIEEHEAIHLGGVVHDGLVWREMKKRYSSESLSLEGDPRICTFCPIPKRLKED